MDFKETMMTLPDVKPQDLLAFVLRESGGKMIIPLESIWDLIGKQVNIVGLYDSIGQSLILILEESDKRTEDAQPSATADNEEIQDNTGVNRGDQPDDPGANP